LLDEYRKATKKRKSLILDEFCNLTGYNRSYASRKLRAKKTSRMRKKQLKASKKGKQGRKPIYGPDLIKPLIKIWAVMDLACGKRVVGGMADMLDALVCFGEIDLTSEQEEKLRKMSAATIDRLLKDERKKMCLKGRATTKPGTLLKSKIPIRTGTEWDEEMAGYVEMDTVAHCGETTRGQYVVTLDVTDIETCWTEQRACFNKAESNVFPEVKEIRRRLPFPLFGVDSDCGGEFINAHMYKYCKTEGIHFTRGRPYKKNDGCHVEQKNWSVVRQTIGYGRFETKKECALLNEIYDRLRLLTNFFMPSQKLLAKERDGARVVKKLDKPLTPYRRVLGANDIDSKYKQTLTKLFTTINPARLRRDIVALVSELYELAAELRGPQKREL
jgi:hypothetical protein